MTFCSKIVLRGGLSEVRDRVLLDVRRQLNAGKSLATVEVTEPEVGMHLGVAVSLLCSEIEAAGFRVLHANNPEWSRPRRTQIIVSGQTMSRSCAPLTIDLRQAGRSRSLSQAS
jgi:hypothetical protein